MDALQAKRRKQLLARSAAVSQGDTRAECCARHRSRFSRWPKVQNWPLGEVPLRSAPRHATPSKWSGRCRAHNRRVHSGNRDQVHRGVKHCSQLRDVQRHHSRERGSSTCNVHLIRCGVCLLPAWELEVFVAGQGPCPDPARQSPCESILWLGSSVALKSASIRDREVQPERALSQSFVESLRIPSRARCQGESFGHGVTGVWSECWRWTSERGR